MLSQLIKFKFSELDQQISSQAPIGNRALVLHTWLTCHCRIREVQRNSDPAARGICCMWAAGRTHLLRIVADVSDHTGRHIIPPAHGHLRPSHWTQWPTDCCTHCSFPTFLVSLMIISAGFPSSYYEITWQCCQPFGNIP